MASGFEEYGYILVFVFVTFGTLVGLLLKGAAQECRSFKKAKILSGVSYSVFVAMLIVFCVAIAGAVVDSLIHVV